MQLEDVNKKCFLSTTRIYLGQCGSLETGMCGEDESE